MLKLIPFALACAVLPVRGAADEQKPPVVEVGDRKAAEVLYKKGKEAFRAKNLAEAARLGEESMKLDPSYPEPIVLRGGIQMEKRDFNGAREFFLRAQKLVPDSPKNAFNLAEVDFVEKKWPTANAAFESLMKNEKITDNLKSLVRFKLMVIALKLNKPKDMEGHLTEFRKQGAVGELAFCKLLVDVHAGTVGKPAFVERSRKLEEQYQAGETFSDAMLEAYYTPAP